MISGKLYSGNVITLTSLFFSLSAEGDSVLPRK